MQLLDSFRLNCTIYVLNSFPKDFFLFHHDFLCRPRRHTSSSSGRKKSSSSLVSPDHGGRGGSGAIRPLDTFVDNSYSATTRDKRTERSKGTSSNCSNGVGALRRLCQDEETLGLSETWEEGAV